MGKENAEDIQVRSGESNQESERKKRLRCRVQKRTEAKEPSTFEEYAKICILKRKKAERQSFQREAFVAAKLQETNVKIRLHQAAVEKIVAQDDVQKQQKLERENEKIRRLIVTLRYFYRELATIKENLKEFYDQVREEYIFG